MRPSSSTASIVYSDNNRQSIGCDAQLSRMQTERGQMSSDEISVGGNCPGGDVWGNCAGKGMCGAKGLAKNVRICMQDYKSLGAAIVICATLVNTQTDTHASAFGQPYH